AGRQGVGGPGVHVEVTAGDGAGVRVGGVARRPDGGAVRRLLGPRPAPRVGAGRVVVGDGPQLVAFRTRRGRLHEELRDLRRAGEDVRPVHTRRPVHIGR